MSPDLGSGASHAWLLSEMANIRSLFEFSSQAGLLNNQLVRAARIYTHWSWYLGIPSDDIIKLAINASNDPDEKAWSLSHLG